MHYRRVRIEGATYFFTVVTHDREKLFVNPATVKLLNDAIAKVRDRHPFEIEAQVVLPDHLHVLWTMPEGDAAYATRWRLIKETFTRSYLKTAKMPVRTEAARNRGEQPIWQRRFWEHTIRDETDFKTHLDYIHVNPVRHGLVKSAGEWSHSTLSKWVELGVYEPGWGTGATQEVPDWAKRFE